MEKQNFKNSTIYQIYTKSFKDSNGDGLGDINGVRQKLDYLADLGVDYLWLTPFFTSPMNDNGYDVADYTAIDPVFGTMEDVEALIREAKTHGIGLMFDMVFNHTSTAHAWFQRALQGDEKYMNYYIFRDGEPDTPPTNWESKFGGNAWEYVPHLHKWYLHLFDVTQADLNWDNPEVREELKKVIRFWKEKGIRGFRFDVVNLISKPEILENDTTGDGRRFYTDGPHVHEYLQELVRDTGIQDMVTVGEMSSTTLDNCIRYTNPDLEKKELSMVFHFQHLKVDYKDGNKWELKAPDYGELKNLFTTWQLAMQEKNGWEAVFWCNHDQPRIVSRLGDDRKYWKESAKMLATCIHLMRGTPYLFQGEEIGMTNACYDTIEDYRDVESTNYYEIMLQNGKSAGEALEILSRRSRDNGRTPMQWTGEQEAGFTEGISWLKVPENHTYINVEKEGKEQDSILVYYKRLIQLRKEKKIIADGEIAFMHQEDLSVLAYRRTLGKQRLLVYNNLTDQEVRLKTQELDSKFSYLIGNYQDWQRATEEDQALVLRPYESIVLADSAVDTNISK
ncbi:MAG: alpha,alpha-phosphotrehalase [Lachnospiraceae bacterium]|nr:alpha,alpha-phosphotrehalase [Lachnospiraceae bacterium]